METVREFRRVVEDFTDAITHDYGRRTPFCEVLHQDVGLPQTIREDADQVRAQAAQNGIELDEDSIKLTIEHEELHEALRRFVVDSMSQGQDATQLAAQMLIVGRRLGLQEAAQLFGTND